MARTHDMDRERMMEVLKRAHFHKGATFVEVYQNCNVFNDGTFEGITAKEETARRDADRAARRRADLPLRVRR